MQLTNRALLSLACQVSWLLSVTTAPAASMSSTTQPMGKSPAGEPLYVYTLRNANGCEAKITNYGGTVMSLTMPDRQGHLADVVLGFDAPAGYFSPAYLKSSPFFGALIGRYGNRIAKGRFSLDGKAYQLPINNAPNTLHGGPKGFDKRIWTVHELDTANGPALKLTYVSQAGEENFPGKCSVTAVYTLTDHNELKLEFAATTDQDTVINLTHHSYFNLHGGGSGTILDHVLTLPASRFLPIDKTSIPLGKPAEVKGTPFDFTQPTAIGARIGADDTQLKNGKGYDHCFVLDGYQPGGRLHLAAHVADPGSGRVLDLLTTEPAVQFYTGNFLDGTLTGKGGRVYHKHAAFCLEPEHYPDSPNHPDYPSTVLKAGEAFHSAMIYRFSVEK